MNNIQVKKTKGLWIEFVKKEDKEQSLENKARNEKSDNDDETLILGKKSCKEKRWFSIAKEEIEESWKGFFKFGEEKECEIIASEK